MSWTTRGAIVAHRSRQRLANRLSWTEVLVLSILIAVPAVIVALSSYSAARRSNSSDDDLTARFLSHEADFDALLQMLDSDRARLPLADGPFDLGDLIAADPARGHDYRALIAKIGVANISYSPRSGNIVLPLVPLKNHSLSETRKSYVYLDREQPLPLPSRPSYARPWPGTYLVTDDHRIKGRWFIRHEGTLEVAFSPH
jgi:hypothetical protein